jgi:hypothetical protein
MRAAVRRSGAQRGSISSDWGVRNNGLQCVRLRGGKVIVDDVDLDTEQVAKYDLLMGLSYSQ